MPSRPDPLRDARRDDARRRTRRRRRLAIAVGLVLALGAAGAVLAAPRLLDDDGPETGIAEVPSVRLAGGAAETSADGDTSVAPSVEPIAPTEGAGAQAAPPAEGQGASGSTPAAD